MGNVVGNTCSCGMEAVNARKTDEHSWFENRVGTLNLDEVLFM